MDFNKTKNLVVYYSKGGEQYFNGSIKEIEIGNTKAVASIMMNHIQADSFEILVKNAYPIGYQETVDIAKKEFQNKERPKLLNKISNLQDYDVVFIGFPNWWGTMPMIVFTFLESHDLKGKTLIPFITHEGSGFGNSLFDLKTLCPDSTILDGLAIKGSQINQSMDKIKKWIKQL